MVLYQVKIGTAYYDFISLTYEKYLDVNPGRFEVVIPLDTSMDVFDANGVQRKVYIYRNGKLVFTGRVEKIRHDRLRGLTILMGRHDMCVLSYQLFSTTTSPPGVPER